MRSHTVVFFLTSMGLVVFAKVPPETRLFDQLLRGYDLRLRPVLNTSDPVLVTVRLRVTRIADFDEDTDVLTIKGWFAMLWEDEYLKWDYKKYDDVAKLHLIEPTRRIWTPDIRLFNSMDVNFNIDETEQAIVYSDGFVLWAPHSKFSVPCVPDHEHQWSCTFTFGSWTYNGFEVDVLLGEESMYLDHLLPSTHWTLNDHSANRQVKFYQCCDEPYPSIDFTFHISKNNAKQWPDDDDDDSDERDDSDEEW